MQEFDIKQIHSFDEDISNIEVPSKFTYPFYYKTTPLVELASLQLQKELEAGIINYPFEKFGKMFGVLVVESQSNKLGFLAAFSGEFQAKVDNDYFVPPIVDKSFFEAKHKTLKPEIDKINIEIEKLLTEPILNKLQKQLTNLKQENESKLEKFKLEIKKQKSLRDEKRKDKSLTQIQKDELIKESLHYKHLLNQLKQDFLKSENELKEQIQPLELKIKNLHNKRSYILSKLQEEEIESYKFLNIKNIEKGIKDIFLEFAKHKAPAGTGNCCAPKLLQFAFKNKLKPIALGEFWWGAPHKSEIRKHKSFYPACTSRCKPILAHMLKGIEIEKNPLLENQAKDSVIKTIYEDDFIIIINKPFGLLSVPGKDINDSVASRLAKLYPNSNNSLIIHRLDQETSGIMILAKDEKTNKNIQKQFIDRTIKKKYIALLEGIITKDSGEIELPLTPDIHNRPYQSVNLKNGKKAKTLFKVLTRSSTETLIEFQPITGRTHQLRVHSSHYLGLNSPIKGDTMYGNTSDRLYLHASWIKFTHPVTKETLEFSSKANFKIS